MKRGHAPLIKRSILGREKGLFTSRVVIKTVIFGFTWWVAVKRGVLDQ